MQSIREQVKQALAHIGTRMKAIGTVAMFLEDTELLKVRYGFLYPAVDLTGFIVVPKKPTPFDGTYPITVYLGLPGDPPEYAPPWITAERREDLLEGGYVAWLVQLAKEEGEIRENVERALAHLILTMVYMLLMEEEEEKALKA